jgi:putative regulator of septum formation
MARLLAPAVVALLVLASVVGCQAGGRTVLKVGDCVNYEPSDDGESTIIVNCAQPHAEEVFSVYLDYRPDATGFPGYEAIGAAAQQVCQADFEDYVGTSWDKSSYSIGFSGPTEADWNSRDHSIYCTLEDSNGGTLTGSARGTAR